MSIFLDKKSAQKMLFFWGARNKQTPLESTMIRQNRIKKSLLSKKSPYLLMTLIINRRHLAFNKDIPIPVGCDPGMEKSVMQ